MSTANIIAAINIAIALMELMGTASEKIKKINSMIEKAREEGRDITQEELDQIYQERKDAMAEWEKAK